METLSTSLHSFFALTPDRILDAVEIIGVRCTGRALALNSMENRVYEVEVEAPEEVRSPSERFRVVKFYRPGRWSKAQLLEEHQFLFDLVEEGISVVAPLRDAAGESLFCLPDSNIFYAVFPKMRGRNPQELSDLELQILGRLLARVHITGAKREAPHRLTLSPETYGWSSLEKILSFKSFPFELRTSFEREIKEILFLIEPLFKEMPLQRVHGDCHFGNIVWSDEGPFLVDFDDMVNCHPMQDLWLLCPDYEPERRSILTEAYGEFRTFPRNSEILVEPLRTLRMIHYAGWITSRWEDPAFQRVFPQVEQQNYWNQLLEDMKGQHRLLVRK